jgi:hypothetical protein
MTYRDIVGIPDPSKANVNSLAVNDPDAAALATHAASTAAHNLGATWEEKYAARGLSRSGLTVGQAGVLFEEFTDVARWVKTPPGGTLFTAMTTLPGGVAQLAPAAGVTSIYYSGTTGIGPTTICLGNGRFYVACRVAIAAAPPADGNVLAGVFAVGGAGSYCVVGYAGAFDALHSCAVIRNGINVAEAVASTVGVDLNFHDLEVWSDATNYYLSVDNETPVVLVPAHPPVVDLFPYINVHAGAAAGITARFDKLLYVFPRAA